MVGHAGLSALRVPAMPSHGSLTTLTATPTTGSIGRSGTPSPVIGHSHAYGHSHAEAFTSPVRQSLLPAHGEAHSFAVPTGPPTPALRPAPAAQYSGGRQPTRLVAVQSAPVPQRMLQGLLPGLPLLRTLVMGAAARGIAPTLTDACLRALHGLRTSTSAGASSASSGAAATAVPFGARSSSTHGVRGQDWAGVGGPGSGSGGSIHSDRLCVHGGSSIGELSTGTGTGGLFPRSLSSHGGVAMRKSSSSASASAFASRSAAPMHALVQPYLQETTHGSALSDGLRALELRQAPYLSDAGETRGSLGAWWHMGRALHMREMRRGGSHELIDWSIDWLIG